MSSGSRWTKACSSARGDELAGGSAEAASHKMEVHDGRHERGAVDGASRYQHAFGQPGGLSGPVQAVRVGTGVGETERVATAHRLVQQLGSPPSKSCSIR